MKKTSTFCASPCAALNSFTKHLFSFILLVICLPVISQAQMFSNPITGTNPNTANPYTTGQTASANITVSGIGRGTGIVSANADNRYNASSWNTAALDPDAYFEWVITPNAGFEIDFTNLVYTSQASGTGATTFSLRSSVDGFATGIGTPLVAGANINLSAAAYQNITTAITFRLYGWNASAVGGTYSVNDFIFNGIVSAGCPPPVITVTENWGNLPENDGNICIGDDATLTTSGGGTYLWSTGATTPSITVSPAMTTTYSVTVTNGCSASAQSTITVNPLPAVFTATGGGCDTGGGVEVGVSGSEANAKYFLYRGISYVTQIVGTGNAISFGPQIPGTYSVISSYNATGCFIGMTGTILIGNGTPNITVTDNSGNLPENDGNICIGDDATLTTSGGGTYLWSTGATTPSITVSPAMTTIYSVTVTNGSCVGTAQTTITVNPPPAVFNATGGGCDTGGGVEIGVSGSEANAKYFLYKGSAYVSQIQGTGNALSFGLQPPGTYTIISAYNATGCFVAMTGNIVIATSITPSITVVENSGTPNDGVICSGQEVILTATGGGTYLWSTGATTPSITVSPTSFTMYTVTVTNGCTGTATAFILVLQTPVTTGTQTDVSCNGGSNGSATVFPTGGSGSYSYVWSPIGGTGPTASGLSAGTYTVTVTDTQGCSTTRSFTITEPSPLSITTSQTDVTCNGANDGTASVNVSGGTPGYFYSWSPSGGTGATATGLSPGVYAVTIQDLNGCLDIRTFTINQPPPGAGPVITPGGPTTFCSGGSVTLTSSAAIGNQWYVNGNPIGGETNQTYVATAPGNYTVTVTNAGCASAPSAPVSVTVNPAPPTPFISPEGPFSLCTGGTVILTSSSATGNQWYLNGNPIGGATNQNYLVTASGDYTVVVTQSGCSSAPSAPKSVIINPIPDAVASPSSQSSCSGAGIQSIFLSGSVGGTSFNWVRDNLGTIGGSIPASGNGNISGSLVNNTGAPITVTFTVTPSANGCTGTPITATVTVNPLPVATISGGGVLACSGAEITLSAATQPGDTYQWGRSLFTAPFTPIGNGATQIVNTSGNYQLIVTNQYNCSVATTTVVEEADYVFNGTLGAGDAQQTGRLNRFAVISTCAAPKACPGLFTTIGQRFYDSYTITNIRNVPVCATIGINATCGTNVFCAAYSVSYNPTSLCTNYLADPGSSFVQAGFYEATIPANSSIVVVVHEVNTGTGCNGYRLTVDVPREALDITVTPDTALCNGEVATLTAPTASSYLWSPGLQTTQSINTIATGPYSVNLTYGNNSCTATATQVLTGGTNPVADDIEDQYLCHGDIVNMTLTGTPPGTTFNWTSSNPALGLAASGSNTISFTANNTTGTEITSTITVTPVNGGCTGTPVTFTITVITQPQIISVTDGEICAPGGPVTLSATGTGSINWYNALTEGTLLNTGPTFTPNITANTTYYVESTTTGGPVSQVIMPEQTNTFPGNTRGYVFTAPADFVMTSMFVPTTASSGSQSIAVVKFNGNIPPPVFSASTNAFTVLFLTQNNPTAGNIPVNIQINAGDVIGILGSRANINSYANTGSSITIFGQNVGVVRLGMQHVLSNSNPQNIWQEPGGSISRVEFEYVPAMCVSSPRVPVTATFTPGPIATATPAAQTICSGGAITSIVLSSDLPNTSYAWTRDNSVTVTGIAASGTGNISGSLINTTTAPVLVTFTVTPTADGCVGTAITATVVVNPIPTVNAITNQVVCNSASTTAVAFTGSVPGTVYDWTNNTPSIGLAASGTGDIASFTATNATNAPVTATITVTPSFTNAAVTCTGIPITFTITVNPTPTVNAITSQVLCNNALTTAVSFMGFVPGTVYNWTNNTPSIGLAAGGTGDIASFTATNATSAPVIATVTVTPTFTNGATTCTGTPITFTITVNPTPNAVATPASQTICSGAAITSIVLTGNVSGTTYNWTRDNLVAATGILSSGSGDISGTLTNTTNAPITVTFTITPTANSCPGSAITAIVIVNPTPNAVATPASQTICSAGTITTIVLTGAVSGTIYNWTRNNTATVTGIAASGSGNISGTLTNTTSAPVTVTFTITPTANGCTGLPITATVLVNPTPNAVATPASQTICSATAITTIALTGSVTGTTYTWTRDNTATVTGIAASGSGNISGTLTNTTNAPVLVTFTVTPSANGCTGPTTTATVLVNPTPNAVATPSSQAICSGTSITTIVISGAVTGTTYSWTRNNTATVTGIAASGSGNISGALINNTNAPVLVTFTVTPSANGCAGTPVTATVVVNPLPVGTISIAPNPACVGSTVQLSATGGVLYAWSGPQGFVSTAQNPTILLTSHLQQGKYIVTITSSAGCSVIKFAELTVFYPPVATATYETSTACTGSTLILHGTGAGSYAWTGPAGFISSKPDPEIPSVTAANSGLYTLIVTSPNGCSATTTVNVTINNPPALSANPTLTQTCEGSSIQLFATGSGDFVWHGPATYTSTQQNPVIDNIPIHLSGTYTVELTASTGCVSTASVAVKVYDQIHAFASASADTICEGQSLQLHAEGGSTYLWNGPAGFFSTESDPRIDNITAKHSGKYYVYMSNEGGCFGYAELTILVKPAAKSSAYASPNPVNEFSQVQFFASNNGVAYSWSGPLGFTSNLQNPSIKKVNRLMAGIYTVTITNENGCPSIIKVNLRVIFTNKGGQTIDGGEEGLNTRTEVTGSVFPNPTNDLLYFDIESPEVIEYVIYDVNGRVHTRQSTSDNKYISTSQLPSGIYQIRWKPKDSSEWIMSKFVKIR